MAMDSAAQEGNIDSLYILIEQNPHVLEEIDSIPFIETPLHLAVRAGHVEFVNEIMTLKPSFSWKMNPQGFRPVHLALEHGHTTMVYHFIEMDKEFVRAKMRGGLTLLHLASQSGDIKLLTVLLKACPDSIKDLTVRNETALHFAVKYDRFEAFEFLLRWLKINIIGWQTILKQGDVEGNTILHIAATKDNTKAMRWLIEAMADLDAENLMGQRAFDIIENQEIKNSLARAEARVKRDRKFQSLITSIHEWIIRKTGLNEKMSNEIRNGYMIVATLVATATYQATMSPPAGLLPNDAAGTNNTIIPDPGVSTVDEGTTVSLINFTMFWIVNTCAFLLSTVAITSMMPKNVGRFLLYGSIYLLTVGYSFSVFIISPGVAWMTLFFFLLFPLSIPLSLVASVLFLHT